MAAHTTSLKMATSFSGARGGGHVSVVDLCRHAHNPKNKNRRLLRALAASSTEVLESLDYSPANRSSALTQAQAISASSRIMVAAAMLPRPDKEATGGEDAFFVNASTASFGVADGVSGWGEMGVDPSKYAKALMQIASSNLDSEGPDPLNALTNAHAATALPGAATALVATPAAPSNPEASAALRVAVVGDCGFRLVRDGRVQLASASRQHSFDCPYQLASAKLGYNTDNVGDAVAYEVFVQPGDVFVAGSDGVWDNVSDGELAALLADENATSATDADACQSVAWKLAQLAQKHSLDTNYNSPYRQSAQREYTALTEGGAADGVSAVAQKKLKAMAASGANGAENNPMSGMMAQMQNAWQTFNSVVGNVDEEEQDSLNRARQAMTEGGKPDDITVVVGVISA